MAMVYRYEWKPDARIPGDAQVIGERLEALRVEAGGSLAPGQVVEDARDIASPLHPCFEWNDGAAAERYREVQARQLIRSVVVRVDRAETKAAPVAVRAFVSVVENEERGYTSTVVAMSDADLRRQVVFRAMDEAKQWRKRYEHLSELASIFAEIDRVGNPAA
jgi:hypothetical protein